MTDLRKAAEDMLETLDKPFTASKTIFQAKEALRQALAQPEQEPVAWVTFNAYGEEDDVWYENPEGKLLDGWTYKPLYTAPPKREWQGLTMQEYVEVENDIATHYAPNNVPKSVRVFAQVLWEAIEAKLKEKNT